MKKCSCASPPVRTDRNFNTLYDAYFCIICDAWLDDVCSDAECSHCTHRPAKPSDTLLIDIQESYENT